MNTKKYKIIYADPPWQYRVWNTKEEGRTADSHYHTMKQEDIQALPIQDICEEDSVLFLWVTAPCLKEGLALVEAWGFTYKTVGFVWIKKNKKADSLFWGMGHYTRANAEICLLATRGKPLTRYSRSVHSVIISRIEEHSKKPAQTRDRIVELFGEQPRIELFARQRAEGWDAWGNEINSDVTLESEV